jgi:hypothetical protein
MRLVLASLLTTVGASLPAQQFDTRGIPADAAIVVVTAPSTGLQINSSPAMKALRERMEKLSAKTAAGTGKTQPNYEKLMRDEFGIDTNDTNNSFAAGVNIANNNGAIDVRGAGVFHVKVDPKKVEAFAKKHGIGAVAAGGKNGWNALQFVAAFGEEKLQQVATDPEAPVIGLFLVDAGTVVIAQPKDAAACFASLAGKTPAFALNPAQKAFAAETGKAYGFFAVNLARLPSSPELEQSGLASAMMAIGEKGANQVYQIAANFTSPEKAKTTGQQIQGFLAAAPLLLAIDPSEPAEQQAMKKMGAELIAGIQPVKVNGNQATVGLSLETEKLLGIVGQILDLAEKQIDAQAGATAPGAPTVKATGGKKKPAGATTSK